MSVSVSSGGTVRILGIRCGADAGTGVDGGWGGTAGVTWGVDDTTDAVVRGERTGVVIGAVDDTTPEVTSPGADALPWGRGVMVLGVGAPDTDGPLFKGTDSP
jgi:hypothetical protein